MSPGSGAFGSLAHRPTRRKSPGCKRLPGSRASWASNSIRPDAVTVLASSPNTAPFSGRRRRRERDRQHGDEGR